MKTIAQRLQIARTSKGWTQAHLAVAAGVSTGTVGNIESGVRQAKGSLPQLAEALGVRHKWLADGEGEMIDASKSITGAEMEARSLPSIYTAELCTLAKWLHEIADPVIRDKAIKDCMKIALDADHEAAKKSSPGSAKSATGEKSFFPAHGLPSSQRS